MRSLITRPSYYSLSENRIVKSSLLVSNQSAKYFKNLWYIVKRRYLPCTGVLSFTSLLTIIVVFVKIPPLASNHVYIVHNYRFHRDNVPIFVHV